MRVSLIANVLLDRGHPVVEGDGVLLQGDLLLVERGDLGLEEVHLVDVRLLNFQEVLFEVGQVFNHFLEGVVHGFGGVVLQGGALRAKQLHVLFVLVELTKGSFASTL